MNNAQKVRAVLMAGGRGLRLQPITLSIPKPLLPLGDKTVIEIIIRRLTAAGIEHIYVSLGHMGHFVKAYLESSDYKLHCDFLEEDSPLGTAGPVGLLPPGIETVLVNNCDILTDLDYLELLSFHQSQNADCTIVGASHKLDLPYGQLSVDDDFGLIEWSEREQLSRLVSGGIYILGRRVIQLINRNEQIDMPQVIQQALRQNLKVRVFAHTGIWYDIGDLVQYERATASFTETPEQFLKDNQDD